MKLYDSNFIGRYPPSTTHDFQDQDTYELYQKNLQNAPNNWIYKTKNITYSYNSNGHRCKDVADLDFDNYVLFIGCSHTEGVGVALEDSYPFILSNLLKCDYYNLGLGSTGIDVLLHNLIIWFTKFEKKPKAVIIQWPDMSRSIIGEQNNLQPVGVWDKNSDIMNFIASADIVKFFDARKVLAITLVETIVKVPVVNLSVGRLKPVHSNCILGKVIDLARDLSHPGIVSHYRFTKSIHQELINTQCLNFYQNTELKK
jgi:hypothetical protein